VMDCMERRLEKSVTCFMFLICFNFNNCGPRQSLGAHWMA
jgi:hypothetical protein